jgi:hypothetical protein
MPGRGADIVFDRCSRTRSVGSDSWSGADVSVISGEILGSTETWYEGVVRDGARITFRSRDCGETAGYGGLLQPISQKLKH